METTLKQSPVIFNEEQHTYNLNDKSLNGVTGILSRQIFGSKYEGIPEDVLRQAAEYGTSIHKYCELCDTTGLVENTDEVWNYLSILRDNQLEHLLSEYLVSDEEYVASSIDKVYKGEKENEYIIADIKTTYKLDKDYLAWQLGIYKYLFELQNPDCKVTKCYGIWLRHEKAELVEIEPKTTKECIDVIECDKRGDKTYIELNDVDLGTEETLPSELFKLEKDLWNAITNKKLYEQEETRLKNELQKCMDEACAKTWRGHVLTMTRKADTVRTDFDKKKFQAEHADLYGQYTKETTIKGGISVRVQQ